MHKNHTQVVLVYLQPFLRHPLFTLCVVAQNREKVIKTFYFEGSKSFKVIDVDTFKKLVANACYDTQHVYAYL